ncbi:MAG: hypothetical protein WCK18_07230 [Prolixibacteraceae bacterium]
MRNGFDKLVISVFIFLPAFLNAQTIKVSGNSYEERCNALISVMITAPVDGSWSVPKYEGPYCFARLIKGVGFEDALLQLDKIYSRLLIPENRKMLDGSNIHFFDHATMHGYMLAKDKLPEPLRLKMKQFMQLSDFTKPSGTLNMEMMMRSAAIMAAEEWSDFKDAKGNNARQILDSNKPVVMKTLNQFLLHNCPEAEAFTYFSTNVMYVRMLAEFSKDQELKRLAQNTYQYMVASLLPGWNQGIYVGNPLRSKGWGNLMTGAHIGSNAISMLCWAYFGNRENQIEVATKAGNENYALNFWLLYPGKTKPDPAIFQCYKDKKYPYIHQALLGVPNLVRFQKYTFQSDNFGLATQSEFPYNLTESQYTYIYKETKRLYLAWQSDETPCVFSVCQDNPERPQRFQTKSNNLGYGENPYHRVLQSKKAAIGVYNVPTDYMDSPTFYRIYVPFTQKGIKFRMEEKGWIFCHTGTMMFAFKTLESYKWGKSRFQVPGHDVLTLKDSLCRKGSWVLETTEISDRYKAQSLQLELKKYKDEILKTCKIETIDYSGPHPTLRYFSLDKEQIELTFFAPDEAYVDQYRINGAPVKFKDEYVFDDPFMKQKNGSDEFSIILNSGTKKFSLNDGLSGQ